MADRYTCVGKQVLRDGSHFAVAATDVDAADIVEAMNTMHNDNPYMPELPYDDWVVPELPLQPVVAVAHHIRREGDEYVCSCGIRWGTDEGVDHP